MHHTKKYAGQRTLYVFTFFTFYFLHFVAARAFGQQCFQGQAIWDFWDSQKATSFLFVNPVHFLGEFSSLFPLFFFLFVPSQRIHEGAGQAGPHCEISARFRFPLLFACSPVSARQRKGGTAATAATDFLDKVSRTNDASQLRCDAPRRFGSKKRPRPRLPCRPDREEAPLLRSQIFYFLSLVSPFV